MLQVSRDGEIVLTITLLTQQHNQVRSCEVLGLVYAVAGFAWSAREIARRSFGGAGALVGMRYAVELTAPPALEWDCPIDWTRADPFLHAAVRYVTSTRGSLEGRVGPLERTWTKMLRPALLTHVRQVVSELLFDLSPQGTEMSRLGRIRPSVDQLEEVVRDEGLFNFWTPAA